MSAPLLLDLFCGAGGAGEGYARAGFEVVGVDLTPQPRYPHVFRQGDALACLDALLADRSWGGYRLGDFAAIHASPPCQDYSPLKAVTRKTYPRMIEPVRERLVRGGVPWVIENVMSAPLLYGVTLCGTMFDLRTYRHRRFEASHLLWQPAHPKHTVRASTKQRKADWDAGMFISVTGDVGVYCAREAMGIEWMTGNELSQAIPPAYTEWLGRQLMQVVEVARWTA